MEKAFTLRALLLAETALQPTSVFGAVILPMLVDRLPRHFFAAQRAATSGLQRGLRRPLTTMPAVRRML